MKLTESVGCSTEAGIDSVKEPSMPVVVPAVVPSTRTVAPMTSIPSESFTTPETDKGRVAAGRFVSTMFGFEIL